MFRSTVFRRARLCAALAAGLCLSPLALAVDLPAATGASGAAPLTLAEAMRRAESRHPLFASQRAQIAAAAARRVTAGMRPAPELGVEVEDAFGTGELDGFSAAQTTLSISQLIERGGVADRRVDAARAEIDQIDTQARIAQLDLRAEVARRFVHVLSDQGQLGITQEATRLAQSTLDEVQRRVQAARSPLAELSRAKVSLERAQLDEEHAEHELLSSRRHLAAATGSVEADFGSAIGDLLTLPDIDDFETLMARMLATPDALRFVSEARLRESELRLAQSRRAAPLRVGTGMRRLESSDDVGLVFSLSMPLFASTRERGAIAEAEARVAQIEPDRERAWLLAQAQLYELYQELHHAGIEVQSQGERVIPLIQQALDQTQYAYERGRYSLLELREAQTEWATQRRRLITAAAEYHAHLIEIQRLTGAHASAVATTEFSKP